MTALKNRLVDDYLRSISHRFRWQEISKQTIVFEFYYLIIIFVHDGNKTRYQYLFFFIQLLRFLFLRYSYQLRTVFVFVIYLLLYHYYRDATLLPLQYRRDVLMRVRLVAGNFKRKNLY